MPGLCRAKLDRHATEQPDQGYGERGVLSIWIKSFVQRPDASLRLVCFPHAGGSAPFYRPLAAALPDAFEVQAVRYPGRAERFGEPPVEDATTIAREVAHEVAADPRPVVLFGHSMGATLAYETARAMRRDGTGEPHHLFVSAAQAAHDRTEVEPILHPDDDVLVARLSRLGGTEVEALADQELRELVLPYIRADLRLLRDYEHKAGVLLRCPVTALTGRDDRLVSPALMARWGELTTGPFEVRDFAGGHFYLSGARGDVVRTLTERVAVSGTRLDVNTARY